MRTVFAVAGVLGHPPLRFLISRHTILTDVVDVMLGDRELVAVRQTGADLRVDVSAVAIVFRQSSTSNGLATARPEAWQPTRMATFA